MQEARIWRAHRTEVVAGVERRVVGPGEVQAVAQRDGPHGAPDDVVCRRRGQRRRHDEDGGQERGHGRCAERPHPTATAGVRLRWPNTRNEREEVKETAVCWGTK